MLQNSFSKKKNTKKNKNKKPKQQQQKKHTSPNELTFNASWDSAQKSELLSAEPG